ncbi:hypothetical protein SUDANB140_00705 [Streptomyces sp. enrichment culture]
MAAVLFDSSGTLFRIEATDAWLRAALDGAGPALPAAELARTARALKTAGALPGGVPPQRVPAELAEVRQVRDQSAELHRAAYTGLSRRAPLPEPALHDALYERPMTPDAWSPYPDAAEVLDTLRGHGVGGRGQQHRLGPASGLPRTRTRPVRGHVRPVVRARHPQTRHAAVLRGLRRAGRRPRRDADGRRRPARGRRGGLPRLLGALRGPPAGRPSVPRACGPCSTWCPDRGRVGTTPGANSTGTEQHAPEPAEFVAQGNRLGKPPASDDPPRRPRRFCGTLVTCDVVPFRLVRGPTLSRRSGLLWRSAGLPMGDHLPSISHTPRAARAPSPSTGGAFASAATKGGTHLAAGRHVSSSLTLHPCRSPDAGPSGSSPEGTNTRSNLACHGALAPPRRTTPWGDTLP